MSNFDNKSLKNIALKSTSTHQYSTSKTVKSNRYLTGTEIHNDTTYDNFSNTTYGVDVPQIENDYEYYARKFGEEYLNSNHNRSIKHTPKHHVNKLN